MDESVEIVNDVGVKIVDDVDSKNTCCLFEAFNVAEGVALEGAEAVNGLLVIVVSEHRLQVALNLQLLLLHHVVHDLLHPRKVGVHVASTLALHVLCPV